jgi:O-succinylbenzoic acid--CoA ligase
VFTAGAPLFCTRVALRGEVAPAAAPDVADEILVKSPTLALGVAGPGGWFATGDRGARSADGSFSVVGRVVETIISGGENVAPTEVEAHLIAQPGIADAAVLGVPDEEWGERIEARVVLASGAVLDEPALRAALRAVLPPFAVPKTITAVDALPRTPTGKLRRRDLR